MASSKLRRITPREFLTHPAARGPSELVRGEIRVVTPAGGAHGVVAAAIFRALDAFVEHHGLGICFADNTGFQLPGRDDTVRSPDAAFVRAERLPAKGIGMGWLTVAPDLVVEIISPNETAAELEEKLIDYFAAGTAMAWVIDPAMRTASVRRVDGSAKPLSAADALDGADVLPGFVLPLAKLFERLAP